VVQEKLKIIIFSLVWFLFKKIIKLIFLKKTKTEPKPVPTGFGSVRFGFLRQKPVQTGLARFWLGFFSFDSFFFLFGLDSVRFFWF
jgi:hypothetical protein